MAKDQGANLMAQRRKAPPAKTTTSNKTPAAVVSAAPVPPKKRTTPTQFYNEVRAEARKITWTSWKETWVTSVMVGIMVVITAIFFMAVDGALNFLIQQLLKLASG
jgi:preprotein translocase subunit SecE